MSLRTDPRFKDAAFAKAAYETNAEAIFCNNSPACEDEAIYRRKDIHDVYGLLALERFVNDVMSSDTPPFTLCVSQDTKPYFQCNEVAQWHFRRVPEFIEVINKLSPRFSYSEQIEVFRICCVQMNLLEAELPWHDLYHTPQKPLPQFGNQTGAELFNALVEQLRVLCVAHNVKEKARIRHRDAEERSEEYQQYVGALFSAHTRLVVIRIDLYYQKSHQDEVTAQSATKDLNHFLRNMRKNKMFRCRVGYIVKLEYGIEKGLHYHLILFFDGAKRDGTKDIYIAQQLGNYWVEVITVGRGDYWNCNQHRAMYERKGLRGIGVINAYETKLIDNLKRYVVAYLCKPSQFLKPMTNRKIRLTRRGEFPKQPTTKRGRPRKDRQRPGSERTGKQVLMEDRLNTAPATL